MIPYLNLLAVSSGCVDEEQGAKPPRPLAALPTRGNLKPKMEIRLI